MIIKKIEVFGYGKWIQESFELDSNLQVFSGPNESGKSSIRNLIGHILYGFPNRTNKEYSFTPKKGQTTGGRLYIEDSRYGRVILERTSSAGKGKLRWIQEDGQVIEQADLGPLLFHLAQERFQAIYSFNWTQLQDFGRVSPDMVNDYLLSIGFSGSQQLVDLAKAFDKSANQVYRNKGTKYPLNQELKELQALEERLLASKEADYRYQDLQANQYDIKEKRCQIRKNLQKDKTLLEKTKHLRDVYPLYQEWLRDKEQLSKQTVPSFSKDLLVEFERVNLMVSQTQERIAQTRDRLKELDVQLTLASPDHWIEEHQVRIWQVLEKEQEVLEKEFRFVEVGKLLEQVEHAQDLQLATLGFSPKELLPPVLPIEDKVVAQRLVQEEEQIQEELSKVRVQREVSLQQVSTYQNQTKPKGIKTEGKVKAVPLSYKYVSGFLFLLACVLPVFYPFELGQASFLLLLGGETLLLGTALYLAINKGGKRYLPSHSPQDQYLLQTLLEDELAQQGQLNRQVEELEGRLDQVKQEIQAWLSQHGYQDLKLRLQDILYQDPFESYRHLKEREKALEAEAAALSQTLETYRQDIAFFKQYRHEKSRDSLVDEWRALKTFVQDTKDAKMKQQTILDRKMALESELSALEKTVQVAQEKTAAILEVTQTSSQQDFYQLFDQMEKQEQLLLKMDHCWKLVGPYQEQLARFSEESEIEGHLTDLELTIQDNQLMEEQLNEEWAKLEQEMKRLEENGAYHQLLQDFEDELEVTRTLMVDWAAYKLASQILQRTLSQGKEDQFQQVLDQASSYFSRLTYGSFKAIHLSKGQQLAQASDGEFYQLNQLSQGTLDQLYVSMRLAFIKHLARQAPLPLIVDDGFVNFDEKRKTIMMEILQEISQVTQVIYFTLDSQIDHIFPRDQITLLSNNRQESR